MAVKFNSMRKKIKEEGTYIFEINSVAEVTTKKNKHKIVINTTPYDSNGQKYESVDIWFDANIGDREDDFLEAMGNPDELEETIGKRVRAEVTFYESDNGTYINTNNFSAVEQDDIIDEEVDLPFK